MGAGRVPPVYLLPSSFAFLTSSFAPLWQVIAVSDVASATANPGGLDIAALKAHSAAGKPLKDFPGGHALSKDDILTVDCDVLVPAALGGVIDPHVAEAIRAKYVIEAANAPTTPDGDQARIIRRRGEGGLDRQCARSRRTDREPQTLTPKPRNSNGRRCCGSGASPCCPTFTPTAA